MAQTNKQVYYSKNHTFKFRTIRMQKEKKTQKYYYGHTRWKQARLPYLFIVFLM